MSTMETKRESENSDEVPAWVTAYAVGALGLISSLLLTLMFIS